MAIERHTDRIGDLIPAWRHEALLGALGRALGRCATDDGDLEGGLVAYQGLSELRAGASSLLLLSGEPLKLPRDPVAAYLLRPLDLPGPRWLLVQYGRDGSHPPAIQILTWDLTSDREPLDGRLAEPFEIDDERADLSRRAWDLVAIQPIEDQVLIYLAMKVGRLEIKANAETRAIESASWNPSKYQDLKWERAGFGDTPRILAKTRPFGSPEWRDDQLKDPEKNPITLPPALKPGHIHAADCVPGNPRILYVGNNRARVYRIDLDDPGSVRASPRLGGVIREILVQPHSDGTDEFGVFAICNNGIVYLLDERSDGSGLRIAYHQYLDRHIRQLFGVDGHLIALDQSQNLIPLRLGNQVQEARLLRQFNRCALECTGLLSDDHPLWNDPDGLDGDERERLAILALDAYLYRLGEGVRWGPDPVNFQLFCSEWLTKPYANRAAGWSSERAWRRAVGRATLHRDLLRRLLRWLEQARDLQPRVPGTQWDASALGEFLPGLWTLLTPPKDAPDYLWTELFIGVDSLEPWIERFSGDARELLSRGYDALCRRIRKMRRHMLAGLAPIRRLGVHSAMRLTSRPRHLRVVDSKRRLLAFVEYGRALRLVRAPADIDHGWELLATIEQDHEWEGLPRALASGPRLSAIMAAPQGDAFVFLGTDRGELHLYRVDDEGRSLREIARGRVEMDVRCCTLISDELSSGLLIGGSDATGTACLHWLTLNTHQARIVIQDRELWKDVQPGGSLRTLGLTSAVRSDRLWATDSTRGALYRWRLRRLPGSGGVPCLDEQRMVIRDRKDLYALAWSSGGHSSLVITGGRDALTFAFDKDAVDLRWAVRNGRRLTQAFLLPGVRLWLLCSDDEDAILVDDAGTVSGSLLRIGPISGGRLLDDETLVLGNQDGRLLLLSARDPGSHGSDVEIPQWISAVERYVHYPIRSVSPLAADDLKPTLEAFRDSDVANQDPFCALALLYHAWAAIREAGFPRPVERTLGPVLQNLPTTMLASFLSIPELHRYVQRNREEQRQLSTLFTWLWRGNRYREDNDERSHQTLAMLEIQERDFVDGLKSEIEHSRTGHLGVRTTSEAPRQAWTYLEGGQRALFQEILSGIWQGRSDFATTLDGYWITGLQLGQAARMWQAAGEMSAGRHICDRINRWLDLLWRLWGTIEPERFKQRLGALLDQGVPLLPEPWYSWMTNLLADPLAEELSHKPLGAPAPLDLIESLSLGVWKTGELDRLYAIQQQDPAWHRWLNEIQGRLQALSDAREQKPCVVWRVRAELNALLHHVSEETEKQFSLASSHGLLVLWLPRLKARWERILRPQIEGLDGLDPAAHLDVRLADDERWPNTRQVDTHVRFHNRYQYDIEIESAEWEGAVVDMTPRAIRVRADEEGWKEGASVVISLETAEPNRLAGSLRFHCVDTGLNRYFTVSIQCEKARNLDQFFRGESWAPTGVKLEGLLTENARFCWIDGHHWDPASRAFLKELVASEFGQVVGRDQIQIIDSLSDAIEVDGPLFVPDIPLGERSPASLVDWLHLVLHDPKKPAFKPLALAIWHRAHPLPPIIERSLGDLLPAASRVKELLLRLLGGTGLVEALDIGLAALPPRALGAWCYGDPVYAGLLERLGDQLDVDELYERPAGLLGIDVWRRLDTLSDAEISAWIQTPAQELGHRLVSLLFASPTPGVASLESVARSLLHKLGSGGIARVGNAPVWRLHRPLVLLELEYEACFLSIGTLPSPPVEATLGEKRQSFWLSIGSPPPGLAGPVLQLSPGDCLRLVHARDSAAAMSILNQRLATQGGVDAGRIFRIANGLGVERRVARHFFGRDKECQSLLRLLAEHDRPDAWSGVAVLVVGGRRMGKTSLREWFDYRVHVEAEAGAERLAIPIDWQALPQGLKSADLLHWFYHTVLSMLRARGWPLEQPWVHPQSKSEEKTALNKFWEHLQCIKRETRKTPLLLFDETHVLVRRDYPGLPLFTQLRQWVSQGLLCLVATTYPHGMGQEQSLNILKNESGSPIYNLFSETLRLRPWSPDDAWVFLHTRLDYLGVTIPVSLRDEVLQVSQGIPWIVHQLGLGLSEGRSEGRRLVTDADWRRARANTLKAIEAELKETVRAGADRDDRDQLSAWMGRGVPDERRLGNGRLWRALLELAGRHTPARLSPVIGADWPDEVGFDVAELHEIVGHRMARQRLHKVLNGFTDTNLLSGDDRDPDRFYFANNLLPAWLQLAERIHE